jgi:glutamate/aspartate transport system substrate-binding protein
LPSGPGPRAGRGQTAAAAEPAAISASPTLRKIHDTGLITVGYRLSSPPFSYLNLDRQPVGYSVDLCRKVVQAVRQRLEMPDLEVRMMGVSSATRLPLVANGTADLECGVTTHNVERESQVAFSLTIFVASSKLLSRKDARCSAWTTCGAARWPPPWPPPASSSCRPRTAGAGWT